MESFSPQSHQDHKESQSDSVALIKENETARQIVDCAFKIHTSLGPGLLEGAYEECLAKELAKRGIGFNAQHQYPLFYDGDRLQTPYRVDFLVNDCVIVELKSVERILPVHEAQILTYLKLSGVKLGLLINFSSPLIKTGIKRFIN